MRRGHIGLDEERSLVTLGGRRLLPAAQHVTRAKLMDPRPQRREEAFRYLRILLERLRAADGLTVQSPRAVEATEGRSFDVVLVGLTPTAATVFFPARDLRTRSLKRLSQHIIDRTEAMHNMLEAHPLCIYLYLRICHRNACPASEYAPYETATGSTA